MSLVSNNKQKSTSKTINRSRPFNSTSMSDSKISFKIESLPKLEGQSNYTRWAGAIKLALKAYKLYGPSSAVRKHGQPKLRKARNLESRQQLKIRSNGKNRTIRREPSSRSLSWPMTLRLSPTLPPHKLRGRLRKTFTTVKRSLPPSTS